MHGPRDETLSEPESQGLLLSYPRYWGDEIASGGEMSEQEFVSGGTRREGGAERGAAGAGKLGAYSLLT